MARNKLAGLKRGLSASAQYYQNNPEAAAVKNAYNKEYQKSSKTKKKGSGSGKTWGKYRALLQALNRKNKTHGNHDNMDESHTKRGGTVKEHYSKNRARNRGKK